MQSEKVLPVADEASRITSLPAFFSLVGCSIHSLFVGFMFALTFDHWYDSSLLHWRRAFEAVFVNTAEEPALEIHLTEGRDSLIMVGLEQV